MQPIDLILQQCTLPWPLRKDQVDSINTLCNPVGGDDTGCYMDVGVGKTVVSTLVAIYFAIQGKVDQLLVVAPPILLDQWFDWLDTFPGMSKMTYRGTIKQREAMKFDSDVIIMTPQILKNDYRRLITEFRNRRMFVIVDEATCIRVTSTLTHKAIFDLGALPNKYLMLLTGTAIDNPIHCYGYIRFTKPGAYRDYPWFVMSHITEVDEFKRPVGFKNLELLAQNMCHNSVRVEANDVLDLPEVTYVVHKYRLEAKHRKLYEAVVEQQVDALEDSSLTGLSQQAIFHTLQRVLIMPSEFGGEKIVPQVLGLIDETWNEMNNEKLLIFCNYNSSNEAVFEYVQKIKGMNPVIAYGGKLSSSAKNRQAVSEFLTNPKVNVLIGNPKSIGVGLNLQSVCRVIICLELPFPGSNFKQVVGRIKREGQKKNCIIKIAQAIATIQTSLYRNIMTREGYAQRVMPTKDSIKRALLGLTND